MKVSSEGGTPVALPEVYFRAHDISPDGTRLLGQSWHEEQRRIVLAQYSLADGKLQLLGFSPNAVFTPDGGLAGGQRIQGRSVVGVWPPGGGVFKPDAPPTTDSVYGGAVSSSGRIVISRGQATNDAVLISAKPEPQ